MWARVERSGDEGKGGPLALALMAAVHDLKQAMPISGGRPDNDSELAVPAAALHKQAGETLRTRPECQTKAVC